jgi:hypothetical protein
VQRLIDDGGRNGKVIDWLYEITADCPKKQAHNMNDPCGMRFPDLHKRDIPLRDVVTSVTMAFVVFGQTSRRVIA